MITPLSHPQFSLHQIPNPQNVLKFPSIVDLLMAPSGNHGTTRRCIHTLGISRNFPAPENSKIIVILILTNSFNLNTINCAQMLN